MKLILILTIVRTREFFGDSIGPSAYLSVRSLHQLASHESSNFPQAAKLIFNNMHVDDVLFGTDDIDDAISLAQELSDLLIAGGFPLRKWSANHPDLLKHLPVEWLDASPETSQSLLDEESKLLGIL